MERCIERHALRMCASALFAQTHLKRARSFRGPMNDKSTICLKTLQSVHCSLVLVDGTFSRRVGSFVIIMIIWLIFVTLSYCSFNDCQWLETPPEMLQTQAVREPRVYAFQRDQPINGLLISCRSIKYFNITFIAHSTEKNPNKTDALKD